MFSPFPKPPHLSIHPYLCNFMWSHSSSLFLQNKSKITQKNGNQKTVKLFNFFCMFIHFLPVCWMIRTIPKS